MFVIHLLKLSALWKAKSVVVRWYTLQNQVIQNGQGCHEQVIINFLWLIWVFNFLFQESIQFLPWQNIAVKGSGSYLTTPWSLTMVQLTTSSSCLKYWLMVQNISQLWSAATKNKLKHKQQSLLWKAWALFLKMLTCLLFSGTLDSPFPHYALPRAHRPEWATWLCPCNGVFTDQFIHRSNFSANFDYQIGLANPMAKTGDLKTVFLRFWKYLLQFFWSL